MAKELRLALFGGLHLTLGGVPLAGFVSNKAPALLCYLALTGRPHTRAELAGLLWGEMLESVAGGNLRKALSNLNQLVGQHLNITRQEVAFNRESPHWLDTAIFQAQLQADPAEQGPEHWREALALYLGDFLQGFYLRDAPAFETWMLLERDRLRTLAIGGLQRLAAYHRDRHEYAVGLDYTNRLLTLEPWREEAHRLKMYLLAHSGQRSAALAQYATCRRLLAEEFGADPAPETTALDKQIREGALAQPNNVPHVPTPIVGRASELAQIGQLLDRSDCRLLTLVGMSGVGKSRLALEVGKIEAHSFEQGVFWVPLSPVRLADLLVPTIADVVGLPLFRGEDPTQQLVRYLSEKRLLLILDSFEHLLDGAQVVSEILAHAPGVKVLVTSTERLALQGEWVLMVGGLQVPASLVDPDLEEYSAIKLFLQRAQRLGLRMPLAPTDRPCVVRICQLVAGIPLGIELAAAWVRSIPCCAIAAEIERNHDFLVTSFRNVPERHRSLRAVFDYAWSLLAPTEQAVFARLSVFRNGFERVAAEQIADASLGSLSALVEKSLLIRGEAGRYHVHDLLRQYAAEKLEQANLAGSLRDRHLVFFSRLAEEAEARLHGPGQLAWLDRLDPEHDNLRAALEWALRVAEANPSPLPAGALSLAGSLGLYWDLRGYFREGREWLARALKLAQPPRPDYRWQAARSQALYWAGHLAKWQGDYRQAALIAEDNLALCRELGDDWRIGYALYLLGSVLNKQGNLKRAEAVLEESERLLREAQAAWGLAHTLGTLGNIANVQGRHSEAVTRWQESYDLYREIGDRRGLARSLNRLWRRPYAQGDYRQAQAMLENAAALFEELKHRDGVAIILRHLGLVVQTQGDAARARALYLESRSVFQELGDKDDLVYTFWYLGRLELLEGNLAEARAILEQGRSLAREVGNKGLLSCVTQTLASVARHEAAYDEARLLLDEAWALALTSGDTQIVADALDARAALALATGQYEHAVRTFGAAEAVRDTRGLSLPAIGRAEYDRSISTARAQMGEAAFAEEFARGRAAPLEQVVQISSAHDN